MSLSKSQSIEGMEWVHQKSTINDKVSACGKVASGVTGEKDHSLADVLGQASVGQRLELGQDLMSLLTPIKQQHCINIQLDYKR